MTEKRFGMFKSKVTGLYVPVDKQKFYKFSGIEEEYDCMRFIKALNDLEERGTINGKLASKYLEENEQLKQQCKDFIEMLDDMSVAYLINDGLEEILND